MIGYVTIGAKDSEARANSMTRSSARFGHERKFADGGWIGYGAEGRGQHSVYVCPPATEPATFGNG